MANYSNMFDPAKFDIVKWLREEGYSNKAIWSPSDKSVKLWLAAEEIEILRKTLMLACGGSKELYDYYLNKVAEHDDQF